MAELAREIRKHMSLLDNKVRQSNKHLEFITGDAKVAIARYQGVWKAIATVGMLLPGPWIPGPVVRSGINWIFTESPSEAFNFHRSFLPGIVLKAAYGNNVPEWANAVFENGLNAPATVVGTDGMVYRVDGTFPVDYKNAGKASFKYVRLEPGQDTNYGGTTLKIPSITVADSAFEGSMAVQLANGDPEIDKMVIIDAVELQVLNAVKMLRGIESASNESASAALQGLCLKVIGDVLLKYYSVRWLSERNVEAFYPSALANVVRSLSYPVEHEGAIQYRYGMYHQSLSTAGTADWFDRARLQKAQRHTEVPEAVWNRADSETFDSDYKRLLKNIKHGAVTQYATNLMCDNGNNRADNERLAANLLCFKAYCYAYGIHVGDSLSAIVQGGTLADTNSDTASWGTKNVVARYTYPALRNSFKVLTSALTWRTASADTHARLLFPLAMYASLLELRFGTSNTAILQYEAIDDGQHSRYRVNREVVGNNVQLAQAPAPQNGQKAAQQFFALNGHVVQALSTAFASEFAGMNSTVQIHEQTGTAPVLQQVRIGGDDENPVLGHVPSGQVIPVFDLVRYDTALYDATLLGILDSMLSSAYFVYQTIGWDYSLTKLWGGDQFLDWGLFNDPMLIGYITLRKRFIRNYDEIVRRHCAYLKDKLKDGWTTSGTSWWAPTPRTWKGVGILSQALSQPGTWLGKALDGMCAWLTNPATAHAWDFSTYGQINALQAAGDEALDPNAQNGFSNFVAQELDLHAGTQSNTARWAKTIQGQQQLNALPSITAVHAASSQADIAAACDVLGAYLSNGGSQKKVLELILKMLPKLA